MNRNVLRNLKVYALAVITSIVTVFLMLPGNAYAAEEYTPVEWIFIDQDIARTNHQRFDTGVEVSGANTLKWELQASDFVLSNSNEASSFCGTYDGKRSGYYYHANGESGLIFHYALGLSHDTSFRIELPELGKCNITGEADKTNHKYSFGVNDNIVNVSSGWPNGGYAGSDDFTCPLPNGTIKVISACDNCEYMSLRFYGLKIWVDGELAADCIPAIDSDGIAGIYDRIAGMFIGKGDYEYRRLGHHEKAGDEASGCEHDFKWQTIETPNFNFDGLDGEICTKCGAHGLVATTSAYAWTLENYGLPKINEASAGDTVVFEFKQWNSFPKWFMERIAAKPDVTFIFKYYYGNSNYEVTIEPGTLIPLDFDYYGPEKLAALFTSVITLRE